MISKKSRFNLLALVLLLAPAFAQQVNQDILPASTGLNLGHSNQRWNGNFQNLDVSNGGSLSGTFSGNPFLTGTTSAGVLNGTLNPVACGSTPAPGWCSGSDIGAWTNAAIAQTASGTLTSGYGRIAIPPGTYTQSTTINLNGYPNVILDCQGANLNYNGTTIGIDALQPAPGASANAMGGIFNCNVHAPDSPASNVIAYRFGNLLNYKFEHNSAWNFDAPGDVGLLVTNTQYFTEDSVITDNQMRQVTVGYEFLKDCGGDVTRTRLSPQSPRCTNSAEYTWFKNNYWDSPYVAVSGATGLLISGGITLQNSVVELHANVNGPSGGTVVNLATTNDRILRDQISIQAEADGNPATTTCVANSGAFYGDGTLQCDGMTNTGHPSIFFGSDNGYVGNESYAIAGAQVAQYGILKATTPTNYGPYAANSGSQIVFTLPTGTCSGKGRSCTGWYEVSCIPILVTAGTTSTLPSCSISWNDGITGASSSLEVTNTSTANSVGITGLGVGYPGKATIYAAQGTTLNFSTTGYASTGMAMSYQVETVVVAIGK